MLQGASNCGHLGVWEVPIRICMIWLDCSINEHPCSYKPSLKILSNSKIEKRAFDDLCISKLIDIFILFDTFVSFLCSVLFQLDCSQTASYHQTFSFLIWTPKTFDLKMRDFSLTCWFQTFIVIQLSYRHGCC